MRNNKGKSKTRFILLNLLAMLIVVVLLPCPVLMWLDDYTLHGQKIQVPDVCGLQIDRAAEVLRNSNLDFEVVDYKYMKGAAEDEVLEQRPTANSAVKEGRKIQLTMNSGNEPTQTIPDIIDNCSLREAEARLRAAGFKLNENIAVPGEEEWVYGLLSGSDTLRNGMQIPIGSTVTLVIGSGEDSIPAEDEPIIDNSWFE